MKGWFQKSIERQVRVEADHFIKTSPVVEAAIQGVLDNHPGYQFVRAMAQHFMSIDRTLNNRAAFDLARDTLAEYLADEKIAFGDPAYAWDASAARAVGNDYQVDHWERAA